LLTLFGDLKLNGVLPIQTVEPHQLLYAFNGLPQTVADQIKNVQFASSYETIAPNPETVYLRSFKELVRKLDLPPATILQSPELIWLATQSGAPPSGETGEASLRKWLDAYQQRGSFDDRTLMVVFPQDPAS
ncbi:MAG TPA: hypothetical protein PLB18_15165, partial [Acidobacteriota bacterium]|nr:hypothetical protein [Acidobacteriota bacterium]